MSEYEWPAELDVDELEPTNADAVLALQRIREFNRRNRELPRVQFAPQTLEDSELSAAEFFTVISVLFVIFLAIVLCFS